jgi:hypothetical protein
MRHRGIRAGHTMGRWETLDTAAHHGTLVRTQAPSPGAQKLLRPIRMPMRFAGQRCITSGSMQINRRRPPMRQWDTLRPARQRRLKSKRQAKAAVAHPHLHQRRQRVQHLHLRPQFHLPPRQHLQLRQLRQYGLLPRPGRIRYQGNVQRRIRGPELARRAARFRFALPAVAGSALGLARKGIVAASLCRGAPTSLHPNNTAAQRRGYNYPGSPCSGFAVSRRSHVVAPYSTASSASGRRGYIFFVLAAQNFQNSCFARGPSSPTHRNVLTRFPYS